jgi:hypothetical protein
MKPIVFLRYTGSIVLIIGYIILLNVDVFWGVTLRMVANLFSIPWAVKNKVWDFVTLLSIFFFIELHKFLAIILNT